ncbi:MAG: hypothetical protein IT186_14065 [Acidobacteria bacterium]|nr:hypothetical protein [Acidobacteriota bacterium]
MRRWRAIGERYGWHRITFWGHDHKPFLRSQRPAWSYSKRYRRGVPHIPGEEYRALFRGQFGPSAGVYPGDEERVVRFRFRNGYTTEFQEPLALIHVQRGEGEIISQPAGEPVAQPAEEIVMLKFRFKNGYTTEFKDELARTFAARGEGVILDDAPAPEPDQQPQKETSTVWLIERAGETGPEWWTPSEDEPWTTEAVKALGFKTRDDAEERILAVPGLVDAGAQATEHEFVMPELKPKRRRR